MDTFLNPDYLCKQSCLNDLSRYIKVKQDYEVAKSSLIETINNLAAHGCYSELISEEQQGKIANNLTTLLSISLE